MTLTIALIASGMALLALVIELVQVVLGFYERRRVLRHRVVVHIRGGKEFEGLLWRSGRVFVLRSTIGYEQGQPVQIDGEVLLERDRVEWLQLLPPRQAA